MTRIFQTRKLSLRELRWLRPRSQNQPAADRDLCTQICWFDLRSFSSAILLTYTECLHCATRPQNKAHAQLWWERPHADDLSLWGLDPWLLTLNVNIIPRVTSPRLSCAPWACKGDDIPGWLCHTLNSKSDVPQNIILFKHKMQLVSLMKRKSMDYERSKFSVLSSKNYRPSNTLKTLFCSL